MAGVGCQVLPRPKSYTDGQPAIFSHLCAGKICVTFKKQAGELKQNGRKHDAHKNLRLTFPLEVQLPLSLGGDGQPGRRNEPTTEGHTMRNRKAISRIDRTIRTLDVVNFDTGIVIAESVNFTRWPRVGHIWQDLNDGTWYEVEKVDRTTEPIAWVNPTMPPVWVGYEDTQEKCRTCKISKATRNCILCDDLFEVAPTEAQL